VCLASVDRHQAGIKQGAGGEVLEDVLALAIIEGNIEVSPAGVELHDNLLPARGWVVDALEAVYEQCVHPLPDWLRLCHCVRCTATTTCSSAYTSQTNTSTHTQPPSRFKDERLEMLVPSSCGAIKTTAAATVLPYA
jgi:hypothetical protein